MNYNSCSALIVIFLTVIFSFACITTSFAGSSGVLLPISETDTNNYQLYSFFDLRERESFVQVTTPGSFATLHIQVFDVSNLCNENNFFDSYTADDTHVYNLRDILTNDGNPSGVELPNNAYGFVVITAVQGVGLPANTEGSIFGNFRVIDNTGYEYRTNSQGPSLINTFPGEEKYTFNFNTIGNVTSSDVIGITVNDINSGEVTAAGSTVTFNTTLFNNNEIEFSCSDTTFSCTDSTFEYGINDAIPNSRNGGVTCGSNVVSEGLLQLELLSASSIEAFAGYIGINNGNGRGSMDSFHQDRSASTCEERGECRVFISFIGLSFPALDGNLGGVAGADAICQSLADNAGLGGRYLAWISDNLGNSPDSRFNKVNVPYVNESFMGTILVANSYEDLTDCSNPDCLINPIEWNETGNSSPGAVGVWTGTGQDGLPSGSNCNNWTSNDMNDDGVQGLSQIMVDDSRWTNLGATSCFFPQGELYCFEQ